MFGVVDSTADHRNMRAIRSHLFVGLFLLTPYTFALRHDSAQTAYNLNTNQSAVDPLDYSGEWQNHNFTPSPSNWRMPFYTVMLDRFANGNPTNDDANNTQFEHDLSQTGLRHGGDIKGLQDSLDYIQGMGIKVGSARNERDLDVLTPCRSFTWLAVLISMSPGPPTATARST